MKKYQELLFLVLFMFVYVIVVVQFFNFELIMECCKSGVVYIELGEGLGFGFLIYEEGWVVINYYVVEEWLGKDFVEFVDGDCYWFMVYVYDEDIDFVLLKLWFFFKVEVQFFLIFDKGFVGMGVDVVIIGNLCGLKFNIIWGIIFNEQFNVILLFFWL